MPDDALCDYLRHRIIDALGDRISRLVVSLEDDDAKISIALRTSSGLYYGVSAPAASAKSNLVHWSKVACDVVREGIDAKEAAAAQ
jgi:hypothetical protein